MLGTKSLLLVGGALVKRLIGTRVGFKRSTSKMLSGLCQDIDTGREYIQERIMEGENCACIERSFGYKKPNTQTAILTMG